MLNFFKWSQSCRSAVRFGISLEVKERSASFQEDWSAGNDKIYSWNIATVSFQGEHANQFVLTVSRIALNE